MLNDFLPDIADTARKIITKCLIFAQSNKINFRENIIVEYPCYYRVTKSKWENWYEIQNNDYVFQL